MKNFFKDFLISILSTMLALIGAVSMSLGFVLLFAPIIPIWIKIIIFIIGLLISSLTFTVLMRI